MGDRYASADSPSSSNERFNKLVQETSKMISSFHQLTRSMQQKISLFGTPQDTRSNHKQLTELSEKGNKTVSRLNRRLQELNRASGGSGGAGGRPRKTQVTKLSSDFKTQVKLFESTCQKLILSEQHSVDHIRRSSQSFHKEDRKERGQRDRQRNGSNGSGSGRHRNGSGGSNGGRQHREPPTSSSNNGFQLNDYNEDQLYAQVNITRYDEDDLARREEDIIHINHQLREVNAAFLEIDGLIQDQGEAVVEIEQNTDEVQDNAAKALEQVTQADAKASYCVCSKWTMIMFGILAIIIVVIVLAVAKQAT